MLASSPAHDPHHNHVISLFFFSLIYKWLRLFFDSKTVTMVHFSIIVILFCFTKSVQSSYWQIIKLSNIPFHSNFAHLILLLCFLNIFSISHHFLK